MTPVFRVALQCQILLLAGACCLTAQSKRPEDLAVGNLLVTPRDAPDPLFAESVILLVRYGETGAVGLMVNRRSTIPISRALREIDGAAGHADPVFVGGPVELNTVLALARGPAKPEGAEALFGDVYLVAARAALEKAMVRGTSPGSLRVYLGYCGWAPRQLETEVKLGGWYIFNRNHDTVFDADPSTLWSRLVELAGGQIVRLEKGQIEKGRPLPPPGQFKYGVAPFPLAAPWNR